MNPFTMESQIPGQRPERLLPDQFWMYSYKVAMCPLKHSHDWEKCIYAHEGEKARRRPVHKYQAIQCPEARAKKVCPRGEECPCTHHLFEYWLHPDRYMTCLCELGANCDRPICFFAHHQAELRPLPEGLTHAANASGSSRRRAAAAAAASAAAAAAAQQTHKAGSTSSAGGLPSQGQQQGSAATGMGSRQLSAGVLSNSSGSHGLADVVGTAGAGADGSFASMSSGAGSIEAQLQLQQQQSLASQLDASHIRPGFSALDALHSSSPIPAAADVNAELMQQQLPRRAAAGGSVACPSVLVLEAPALLSPAHDLELQQAAEQFSQLNLTAAGTGWLSPSGGSTQLGQSNSNMSLASSTSSTMGIPGLGAEAAAAAAAQAALPGAVNAALLTGRVSPSRVSPGNSGTTLLAFSGANLRAAQQAQAQRAGAMRGNLHTLLASQAGQQAQLAAMQAALDEPPEQLSFSLWDLAQTSAPPGAPQPPRMMPQMVPMPHSALIASSTPVSLSMPVTNLEAFGGFAAGGGGGYGLQQQQQVRTSAGPSAPAGTQVINLASAAANRLLSTQHGAAGGSSAATASIGLAAAGLGGSGAACMPIAAAAAGSPDAMAAEARLTLLRAWVNAAAMSGSGLSRSFDGSVQQQEEELLQAAAGSGSAGPQRLGRGSMGVVANDLARVLSPGDLMVLVQHLQALQN